jgi:hypothetical protein
VTNAGKYMNDRSLFIHSTLDDMTDLSPNAMRVYMHLSRRANNEGKAWPSYQTIGDHCFKSVSDNPITRKSFTRNAIEELIEANLIVKEMRARDDGGQTSNIYVLLDTGMPNSTSMPIDSPMPNKHAPCLNGTPHAYQAPEDTPIEDTPMKKEDDDDTHVRDAYHQEWFEVYDAEMPELIESVIAKDLKGCPPESILHAIRASVNAKERTTGYFKKCALNYVPPPVGNGYSLRPVTGIVDMPPAPKPAPSLPPPLATSDPWATILSELRHELMTDAPAHKWLKGSALVQATDVAGIPLYQVQVTDPSGVSWLSNRLAATIRKKLSTLLRQRVLVEITCTEKEAV